MKEKNKKNADVVVIGFGTAGSNAAASAAKVLGDNGKVLVIHDRKEWNTCVQRGCMPTKSLLGIAKGVLHARQTEKLKGVSGASNLLLDMKGTLERMNMHRDRFEKALFPKLHEKGYEGMHGMARFSEDGSYLIVETSEGEEVLVEGKRYVIAAGSNIFIPPIEGIDKIEYWTSDTVMRMELAKAPETLLIVGAGPIGLELATFFHAAGSKVTILNNREQVGSKDKEVFLEIQKDLEELGITVLFSTNLQKFEQVGSRTVAIVEKDGHIDRITVDKVLMATGRRPSLEALGIEHLKLEMDARGNIVSNDAMQTSNPNIYVAGDVAGKNLILHVAAVEGGVAGHNAALGKSERKVNYEALKMGIIFTTPPIAFYGITAPEAEEQNRDYVAASIRFREFGRGITDGDTVGIWKLIADMDGNIIGSEIFGEGADDLIHLVKMAVEAKKKVGDIVTDPMWYHPTRSELFKTVARKVCAELKENRAGSIITE